MLEKRSLWLLNADKLAIALPQIKFAVDNCCDFSFFRVGVIVPKVTGAQANYFWVFIEKILLMTLRSPTVKFLTLS
ncbi:hypothetical protein NIES2119_15635 [[Phormidium ambiguum] IAM M-71]|uniref:Uncharacterized protein n=1 Tax=[Phormidium ambiguum] IAM M-71 TaxID=454136 RepID=A0A1U7IIE3_9CYAN|nr:hypothetical protein NIES2119_15635 [Phormidium ambiguum IAM M-71]